MRFTIPGTANADIRQIVRDDPQALRARLHQNQLDPEVNFAVADLVPCDFNGNEWEEKGDFVWGSEVDPETSIAEFQSTVGTWELAEGGTPQSIAGWSLWLSTPEGMVFLGLEQFAQPHALAEAGDKFERFFDFTDVPVTLS